MIIDLSDIITSKSSQLEFDSVVNIGKVEFMGSLYNFLQPVQVKGSIHKIENVFELDAQITGSVKVNCFRCMKELEKDFDFSIHENLTNDAGNNGEDEDTIRFQGSRIDITEIVVNNTLMNIPVKYLCSEDCKGLCPACGADLNIEQCNCTNNNIDPRFEVLKKLLNQKE
ncbi:DUF177 domain-containing protein [Petroclostridium sp. X23]|uniref:YceD family protein n=1 Tax=Petroclostridium sp. X23 TaxID=3045146 RepID=UPI0024AE447B|nr:DUF177 domain-containing protein [Petroclostridium sp. X23]WHH59872.1 DUF177 domain-containing protein [Petroclostridium sp. X23]